jgi:MFS family permease
VAVAQFMVLLDATIVNVTLPTIQRDLGSSEQSLSWILNACTHGNQAAEAGASADG